VVVGFAMNLIMLTGLAGCVPEFFTTDPNSPEMLAKIPCQIHTRWDHQIHFPANTQDNGNPVPMIVGRIYLFAGDLTTAVPAEGTILVYLYNDMPDAENKDKVIDCWVIDTKTVKRLERRDAAGVSYTLMLPWANYNPAFTQVRLKVRFDRLRAKDPLYSDTIPVTFENDKSPKVEITHKSTGPRVPTNGMILDPTHGMVLDPTSAALVSSGQRLPAAATNIQPIGSTIGDSLENGEKPTTSVTKSAPSGDNIPFIVPPAGTVFPGNRQQ
jgi:hypothetical protein